MNFMHAIHLDAEILNTAIFYPKVLMCCILKRETSITNSEPYIPPFPS